MHLIIPYAASHAFMDPAAWVGLKLPHLQTLLNMMQRQHVLKDSDDVALHMPQERLLAKALGWPQDSAALPWAAWHSAQQGQLSATPQAWMTPCHWQVGMDQVVMLDPASLFLSDDESQQLLQAMQAFLQEDGLQVTWQSALAWHVQGDMLTEMPTASLDRVIGQNVKPWMPESPSAHHTAKPLQRLQSEMQMLLYNHPVNDAREARRQHTVNAFWLHGAGTLPALSGAPAQPAVMPDALRASALRGDLQAWQKTWKQLDATAVADLLEHFKVSGQATLSLCSEHAAHTYEAVPATWHQRITRLFQTTTTAAALTALITP